MKLPFPFHADLAAAAPSVAVSVHYTRDPHTPWDGDAPSPEGEGFRCYDVEVRASCIVLGEHAEGSDYLGSVWVKPGENDPDVHGYAAQMAESALDTLRDGVASRPAHPAAVALLAAIDAALAECRRELARANAGQRAAARVRARAARAAIAK